MTARKYAGNDDTNTLSCNFLIDRIGERRRLRFSLCPSHDEVSLSCKPRLCNMRIAQDSDVVDSIAPSSVVCHHPWGRYNHAAMCCYVVPLSAESWPPFLMWARCFSPFGGPSFSFCASASSFLSLVTGSLSSSLSPYRQPPVSSSLPGFH